MCIAHFLFQSELHSLILIYVRGPFRRVGNAKAGSVHSRRVPCLVHRSPAIRMCRVFSPRSSVHPAGPKFWLHESNINQSNPTTHPTTTQIPPVRVDAKRYVMASSRRIQDIILTLSYLQLCLFQRLHFSLTWFFKFPARREASAFSFGFQPPLSYITVLICDAASPFSFVVEASWT